MKISNLFFGIVFLISVCSVAMESDQISLYDAKNYLAQWLKDLHTMTQELFSSEDKANQERFEKYDLLIKGACVCRIICQELLAQNPNDVELRDALPNIKESITQIIEARHLAVKNKIMTKKLAEANEHISNMNANNELEPTLDNYAKALTALAPNNLELKQMLDQMKSVAKEFSHKKSQEKQ